MKTNIILTGLVAIIIISCSAPVYLPYLPSSDKIDINPYGSQIIVNQGSSEKLKGELIAVEDTNLIILPEYGVVCKSLPIKSVKNFKLQYARSKDYGWTIPAFSLASFSHGWFAIFSLPINLLATISVHLGGQKSFQYNEKSITYDELRMFARFPQGIPPNIHMTSIGRSNTSRTRF